MPQGFEIRKRRLGASLLFMLVGPAFMWAQGLYESSDRMAREWLEISKLRNSRQPIFIGFRPTSFEIPEITSENIRLHSTVFSTDRAWALTRLSFASVRERAHVVPILGSTTYPIFENSLWERDEGLGLPYGESSWLQTEVGVRPRDWLYLRGSFHGGVTLSDLNHGSSETSPGWYHPESLFLEARYRSFVLSLGRKPLYWGQLESGALILSDNATSFDSLQISTLSQRWPWLFRYLGALKAETFVSRVGDDRGNSHEWYSGLRLGTTPFDLFEMNLSFVYQFGGDRSENGSFSDTLVEILGGRTETGSGIHDVTSITNRSVSLDMRLNLDSLAWPTAVYWENYLEDCCGTMTDILKKSYGYGVGVLTQLGHEEKSHRLRLEYVRLPNTAYWNGTRTDGWTNDRRVFGSPVGRDSDRVLFVWSKVIRDFQLKFSSLLQRSLRTGELVRGEIRTTFPRFATEYRWGQQLGFRWDLNDRISIDSQFAYSYIRNRNNLSGSSSNEWGQIIRTEWRF